MKVKLVAIIAAAALVVAGLSYASVAYFGSADDEAIHLAPKDSLVYVNWFLDPSNDQKRALDDLLSKFPKAPSADEARDSLIELVDEGLREVGLDYNDDVRPWFGGQIAFFISDFDSERGIPNGAALIATKDEDATQDTLDELIKNADEQSGTITESSRETYKGEDYRLYPTGGTAPAAASGFLDGFWLIGTQSGFESAVDASQGESLEDSERFTDAVAPLNRDNLLSYYIDQSPLYEQLGTLAGPRSGSQEVFNSFAGLGGQGPTAGALYARADAAVFETTSQPSGELEGLIGDTNDSHLIEALPKGSWLAIGGNALGDSMTAVIDGMRGIPEVSSQVDLGLAQFRAETGLDLQDDLLAWMEDFGIFAEGTALFELRGGLVIESNDPAAAKGAVARLRAFVESQGAPTEDLTIGDLTGFSVPIPPAPQPVVVLGGTKAIIAYGRDSAERIASGGESLAEGAAFAAAQDALGDGFHASFFVDMDAVTKLIETLGGSDPAFNKEAKPWLEPLTHVVLGTKRDGGVLIQRVVIGAR